MKGGGRRRRGGIARFVSHCETSSKREKIVKLMQNHMQVGLVNKGKMWMKEGR